MIESICKRIVVLMVFLLLSAGISGCKEQTIRLDKEYKNKISEVVLILNYPARMRILGIGSSTAALGTQAGMVGALIGSALDEYRVSHFKESSQSINKIVGDDQYKTMFEQSLVKAVQGSINAKIVRIEYESFLDYDEVSDELAKEDVNTVMYVGYSLGFTPGLSSIDTMMNVKIFTDTTGVSQGAKIHEGNYYYQTFPISTVEVDDTKDKLKSAVNKWKADNADEGVVPYPRAEIRDLEMQQAKYWAKDNGVKVRESTVEGISEVVRMLNIDLSGQGPDRDENSIVAFYRDYREVLSPDEKINNSFSGVMIAENDNRRILRGPNGSLFSVDKNIGNMKDAYQFDGYFFGM